MRNAIAIALWLGGVAGYASTRSLKSLPLPPSPPPAESQDTAPKVDTTPKSASLARRLAEAADGFRDGEIKWIVADNEFPHAVLLVSHSLQEAQGAVKRSEADTAHDYRIYGPFQTSKDIGYVEREEDEIDSVIVWRHGGQKHHYYDGKQIDALFWGMPAFDKFVTPYLTAVYGAKFAAEQRQLYLVGRSPYTHSTEAAHKRTSF